MMCLRAQRATRHSTFTPVRSGAPAARGTAFVTTTSSMDEFAMRSMRRAAQQGRASRAWTRTPSAAPCALSVGGGGDQRASRVDHVVVQDAHRAVATLPISGRDLGLVSLRLAVPV